ncbi:MAG: response regulator [Desulfovibrionaceae bacterium]
MSDGSERILVVDDDPVNRLFLEILLGDAGYDVVTAEDGLDALSVLEREHVHLILMDIVMPRMGGLEAVSLIREAGYAASDAPIVAVTAFEMQGGGQTFLDAGMNGVVFKPVDEFRLLGLVSELMS